MIFLIKAWKFLSKFSRRICIIFFFFFKKVILRFSVWLDAFGIRSDPTSHLDGRQQIKTGGRKILFGCKYKKKKKDYEKSLWN